MSSTFFLINKKLTNLILMRKKINNLVDSYKFQLKIY